MTRIADLLKERLTCLTAHGNFQGSQYIWYQSTSKHLGNYMAKEFIVSGDSHVVEPVDLYKTRLPKNMRDQALWEEDTVLDEPLVPGGHTQFRTVHTTGYEGWTVSRYRQFPGPTPDGLPDSILRDLDRDGVDATVLFPNLSFFALYTDTARAVDRARPRLQRLAGRDLPAVLEPARGPPRPSPPPMWPTGSRRSSAPSGSA